MFMPRQLGHSVEQIARKAVGKDWNLYAALLDHWLEIVGSEYAELSTPVKIAFPFQPNEAQRRNGTLTIRLPKGLAMEFTFKCDQMRQRINSYFGYDAIGRIVFDAVFGSPAKVKGRHPAPVSAEQVEEVQGKVKFIENNDLRDALQALGETMAVLEQGPV